MVNTSLAVVKMCERNNVYNKYYCQQNKENSLVVIFPGEDYSFDKPLLYYAKKAALIKGYDVLCISYKRKLTWRDMGQCTIDLQGDTSSDTIRKCMKKKYDHIYFISKDIGTEVAGNVSSRLGYERIENFYLTPTVQTVKHIANSKCIVAVGTKDSIFTHEYVERVKEYKNVKLILIKDANRYLELHDDLNENLRILNQVTNLYMDFFKNNYFDMKCNGIRV